MKIKSLLLGSAAALMAVTGAQAADAVIVEAEPVEYVRICDAYGAGFFYIPGTETCLRFSGYVRSTYSVYEHHDQYTHTKPNANGGFDRILDTQHHGWAYRARLNIDARNETEWGTLRSQMRLQADGGNSPYAIVSDTEAWSADGNPGDAAVGIDRALISLAGFRLGYSDDYWTTVGGYGYFKEILYSGNYGYSQGLFLDYTYAADGFTATVGISDNRRSGTAGQPDVYVGATYSGAWGRAFGTYYYDSSESNGAYKVGLQLSLADYIPGGAIKGWYMADDGETSYVKGHTWGVTAQMDLADNWSIYGGYSDYNCVASTVGGTFCTTPATDASFTDYTVGLNWNVAPGLLAQFSYSKKNYDYQIDGVVGATTGTQSRLSSGIYSVKVVRSF